MANEINIYVNKTDIGLNNVDNTSDLNKPISTATQTALNGKENVSNKSTDASLGTSDQLYPTQKAVKTYVDDQIGGVSIPDATATVKGKLKLTGDLGGTADSPTVPGLVNKDTITTQQYPYTAMRFDKKTYHCTTGIGGAIAPLTGNITLWGGTNYLNVTSVLLHNDTVEPTFSTNFERSEDSLPYLINNDNIIICTVINQFPTKILYRIVRGGTSIYDTFLTTNLKGANNGLAELDGAGKVPSSQLPSYVDDVVEYATLSAFPVTGESGKIYIALDTNLSYRWGGSVYVEISPSLALGETSTTAYRGDRGKTAYDHSQSTGNPHGATTNDIPDSLNKRYVTDAYLTVLSNTSGTNSGNETTSTIGTLINGSASATPNDSDLVATAESSVLKKITWTNVKAFLKTYFDTIYTTTSAVSTQISTALTGYATQTWVNSQGFITNVVTALGYTPENSANKQTDLTASATKYPTVNAVNAGLDTKSDKNITLNRQTASYVAVAGDNGKLIEMNVATANTLTINTSIFSAGNQFLISQYGAGQTTITAGAGVTLRSNGAKLKTSGQYALVTIIAISSTEFYVAGDLTA